jgi:hypothetical protein
MTTRIFSRSDNGPEYPKDYLSHINIWFPEVKIVCGHPYPVHPKRQIKMCPELVGKAIVTLSEYIILWFLHEIRESDMKPEDLELWCDGQRIRVDAEGELIDRWPGGFYRERADLLFGEA